jgi:undecaprenyl-diphosphatase
MNQTIFLFLNNIAHQNKYLDTFIFFCAEWLSYLIVSILFFYYAYKILREKQFKKYLKEFSIIFISTFIVWGVSQIINYFYYSPRPFLVLDNINVLFEHGNADSFPSGHATFFFSLAFISYFFVPRLLTAFLLDGAIIIALSRIIAGVHWPADIFGAIVLAGVGVYIIKKTILPKLEI